MVTKVTGRSSKLVESTNRKTHTAEKPWMKHLGQLKRLRKETSRINKRVEEAFETIDRDLWD
jgi:hypothetical protein